MNCFCGKIRGKKRSFTVLKESISSTAIPTSSLELFTLPDDVTIVWLDARANLNSDDSRATRFMLRNIHRSVFFFNDAQKCEDLLRPNTNMKSHVFLVVSGKYATNVLSVLKQLPVIDSIFIYCAQPKRYRHLIAEYSPHVIGVFSNDDELRSSLENELHLYHIRAPVLNFFAQKQCAIRDLTRDAASFLWFQLLQRVLMNTQYDTSDITQMLEYCRQHCARETGQQKFFSQIKDFEKTYTSTVAINWYTRQSFIYKLVNQALRTEDIDALYIFRFYISDLCRQLAHEYSKFRREHQTCPIFNLYRGCHLTQEELEKLQDTKGGLISINGFASTSLQRWVAEQFLLRDSRRRTNVEKVLWTIEIDTRIDDIICAYVAPFSEHAEEEEVLFTIGSAFRIVDVTLDEKTNIWHLKATATNAGSSAVSSYMKLINHELGETSEKVIFGTLLIEMGNYLTARRYFEHLIKYSDTSNPDLPAFYYNLGLTNAFQNELDLAEQNFLKVLDDDRRFHSTKTHNIVRTLNALGWIHQESGELSKAISRYKEAESICHTHLGATHVANAQTYTYMGRYYLGREEYDQSKKCYEQALEILHRHLLNPHQRFGILYNEMADLTRRQGSPEQALQLYQRAETVFREVLPQDHPCMAYCWSGMGIVLLQLNDIEEARRHHKKALKTYKRVLPPDHINISISEKNLKCIHSMHILDTYLKVCCQV